MRSNHLKRKMFFRLSSRHHKTTHAHLRYLNLAAEASRHSERGDLAGRSALLGFVISYMCSWKCALAASCSAAPGNLGCCRPCRSALWRRMVPSVCSTQRAWFARLNWYQLFSLRPPNPRPIEHASGAVANYRSLCLV